MSDLQAELNLRADAEALHLGREHDWIVEGPNGLVVDVRLTAIDREHYWLRFVCDGYPDRPFSVKPLDYLTKNTAILSAWPSCEGFRPPTDLCMPVCAEGFALHPEWQSDPRLRWRSEGNPLLRVLEELQVRLNDPTKYRGRAG